MTAKGAEGLSGLAASYSANSVVILSSQRSSSASGRALSAGKEPTTPALHWAITRSGLEIIKRGAATTGNLKRCESIAGKAMVKS